MELMKVRSIKIVDKRAKKFLNESSPSKNLVPSKEYRNVKLEPITPKLDTKFSNTLPHRSYSISKFQPFEKEPSEPVCIESEDSEEYHPESSGEDQCSNPSSEDQENQKSSEDLFENTPVNIISPLNQYKNKLSSEEVVELWINLSYNIKSLHPVCFKHKYHWILYKTWKSTITKGINILKKSFKHKIKSATLIQKTWKMYKTKTSYKRLLKSITYIQKYWKAVWKHIKTFRSIKKLISLLQPYAK
jgi:IQ calmodulin-binding motif